MCERRKRQREEALFEVEIERERVSLLEKKQRLQLEAVSVVSRLFPEPSVDEGVRALLAAVARGVLLAHVPPVADSDDEESDPDYHPGDEVEQVDPQELLEPLEPTVDSAMEQAQPAEGDAGIPSVMLFFSALANDKPSPREMLATELYSKYKRHCVARQECCDDQDTVIQARNSFGMRLRTIDGVHKRQTTGGTRYTFDWPVILKYLRANRYYRKGIHLC